MTDQQENPTTIYEKGRYTTIFLVVVLSVIFGLISGISIICNLLEGTPVDMMDAYMFFACILHAVCVFNNRGRKILGASWGLVAVAGVISVIAGAGLDIQQAINKGLGLLFIGAPLCLILFLPERLEN